MTTTPRRERNIHFVHTDTYLLFELGSPTRLFLPRAQGGLTSPFSTTPGCLAQPSITPTNRKTTTSRRPEEPGRAIKRWLGQNSQNNSQTPVV
ncbi:hypothetical protein F4810DRAFT_667403 [Camillea tinctor]|nr:hypothetical protein F4810DRAFT_667403 [Camillea tinctor]